MSKAFANWINAYKEFCASASTPPLFAHWAAIGAISAALERRVWINTAQGTLFPNMFIMLVAPPGCGKDQAIGPALSMLSSIPVSLGPYNTTQKGIIDHLMGQLKTFQYRGRSVEYCYSCFVAPEFGNLMPTWNPELSALFNDLYNAPLSYVERTRGAGKALVLINPCVSILAGAQPAFINSIMPEAAFSMGFPSRFVMLYWDKPTPQPLFENLKPTNQTRKPTPLQLLTSDLKSISSMTGELQILPDAQKLLEALNASSTMLGPPHPKLATYRARRVLHILKLCMIYAAATGSRAISGDIVNSVVSDLIEAETTMPSIFAHIKAGMSHATLLEYIEFWLRGKPSVSHRELLAFLLQYIDMRQTSIAIETMLETELAQITIDETGNRRYHLHKNLRN
jgi:hypothetical protein